MFALTGNGVLYLKEPPVRIGDQSYFHLRACLRIAWLRWGPRPTLDLTRALVQAMKDYTEAHGARFVLVYWSQGRPWDAGPRSLMPGHSPFSGMGLDVIDTGVDRPKGWKGWTIPGDGHPDARAHRYVAGLVAAELERIARGTEASQAAARTAPGRQPNVARRRPVGALVK